MQGSRAVVALLVGTLTLLCVSGCKPTPSTPRVATAPPDVLVTTLKPEDVPIFREYVGTLEGSVSADIQARVSGYLISQNYKEGTELKKGDLLFQIDPRPFEAALAKARAALAQSQASQRQAELTAQRNVELFRRQVVSAQERDNAVQSNLASKAQTESQQALVKQAELDLEFTKITAPIDGIAGIARAQVGDLVGPSTGVLTTISTVDPIKAYFSISEQRYVEYMKEYENPARRQRHERQLEFTLVLADGSMFPEKGELFATDRQLDPKTGAFRIAAIFPNPEALLRPGQFVRVRVQTEVKKNALLVPQRAVTELQGLHQVAVVGPDNRVSVRPVKVGQRIDSLWIVDEGLQQGERVVVEGLQKVRDGGTVSPKTWISPATPPPQVADAPGSRGATP